MVDMTVPGMLDISGYTMPSLTPTAGQVLVATSTTDIEWQNQPDISGFVTSDALSSVADGSMAVYTTDNKTINSTGVTMHPPTMSDAMPFRIWLRRNGSVSVLIVVVCW